MKYDNLQIPGKIRFPMPGIKHTCVWDESNGPSEEHIKPIHFPDFFPPWIVNYLNNSINHR